MRTYDEAVAVSKANKDYFFLCAFMLSDWVRNLMTDTLLAYHTPDRQPSDTLQDGRAWRAFCELFETDDPKVLCHALSDLVRFTLYDNRYAATLFRALVPLAIEQRLTGRPWLPQPGHSTRLLKRTAEFWCDWVEAAIHLEVHRAAWWRFSGPDSAHVEDIAAFGRPICHDPAVRQFKRHRRRPRKPAHAAKTADPWHWFDHPEFPGDEVETVLIALQPLAKRYRWTARDVFDVIIAIVHRVEPPNWCWSIFDLENYRRDNLGLPDLETCDHQLPAPPAGLALATKICPRELVHPVTPHS
jgi:hypothetical protein